MTLPGASPADAASHAPALAPVLHAARRVVAVPHLPAQRALPWGVISPTERAAAKLPTARDGILVASCSWPARDILVPSCSPFFACFSSFFFAFPDVAFFVGMVR